MTRWTADDVKRHDQKRLNTRALASKPSKYRNVKTVLDGITFDSKREAQRWHELKLRERAGEIDQLERQVPYVLYVPQRFEEPILLCAAFTWIADFVYRDIETDKEIIEDAKGVRTKEYRIKKKWLELQEGIEIQEV